jgi:hypothetical protein
MWSAIGLAAALLGLLLALGWGEDAWTAAAGFLLVACIAVCVVAGLQSRAADREVRRAVARLASARREEERRRSPRDEPTDGR